MNLMIDLFVLLKAFDIFNDYFEIYLLAFFFCEFEMSFFRFRYQRLFQDYINPMNVSELSISSNGTKKKFRFFSASSEFTSFSKLNWKEA